MGWRTLLGLPLAGAVVMFLFLFMAGVIEPEEVTEIPEKLRERITLAQTPEFEPVFPTAEPPVQPTTPPPPEFTNDPIDTPRVDPGAPTVVPEPQGGGGTLPVLDTEPTPVVTVAPSGFERCIDNEGETHRVRLLFDISPQGETANIEIIDSTDACYERSAVRALRQWRYNPKVVNGEPVWQYGRQATILYET